MHARTQRKTTKKETERQGGWKEGDSQAQGHEGHLEAERGNEVLHRGFGAPINTLTSELQPAKPRDNTLLGEATQFVALYEGSSRELA